MASTSAAISDRATTGVTAVLRAGTQRAREVTGATLAEVRDGIGLFSLEKAA